MTLGKKDTENEPRNPQGNILREGPETTFSRASCVCVLQVPYAFHSAPLPCRYSFALSCLACKCDHSYLSPCVPVSSQRFFHSFLVHSIHLPYGFSHSPSSALSLPIDPLHKWRLNLNNNTLYILSLVLMFSDKGFFTCM